MHKTSQFLENHATILKIAISGLKYLSYSKEWIKALFIIHNGGYNVYHTLHKFSRANEGGEVEKIIGKILAFKYARQVEFLPEYSTAGGKADMQFDNLKWEVKSISNTKIRKALRDAAKADNVIFWLGYEKGKLELLKKAILREIGYAKQHSKMLPDIFYVNSEGNILLLYKKRSEPSPKR